jgi:hypothetical protein
MAEAAPIADPQCRRRTEVHNTMEHRAVVAHSQGSHVATKVRAYQSQLEADWDMPGDRPKGTSGHQADVSVGLPLPCHVAPWPGRHHLDLLLLSIPLTLILMLGLG